METDLIIASEYCQQSRIEPSFIALLETEGLIDIRIIEGTRYLHYSQLCDVERYFRMYYDLSINIEGIDAIRHLLKRMESLQRELSSLRNRLRFHENSASYLEYPEEDCF